MKTTTCPYFRNHQAKLNDILRNERLRKMLVLFVRHLKVPFMKHSIERKHDVKLKCVMRYEMQCNKFLQI